MLAHILGEVGTLHAVLLLIYPSTYVPIFIEICLCLLDTEQKVGWHRFLRHGVVA